MARPRVSARLLDRACGVSAKGFVIAVGVFLLGLALSALVVGISWLLHVTFGWHFKGTLAILAVSTYVLGWLTAMFSD